MLQYEVIRLASLVLPEFVRDEDVDLEEITRNDMLAVISIFETHVHYVALLSAHEISEIVLEGLLNKIYHVHRVGSSIYERFGDSPSNNMYSVTNRNFLTTNSHTTYHYVELVKRFGSTSCFSTLAFESKIGDLRKLCDSNRSRHSAQITLPKQYWEKTLAFFYLKKSSYVFDQSNSEVYLPSKKDPLVELITSSGLVIHPNCFYLTMNETIVKVLSLKIVNSVCEILCSKEFVVEVDRTSGPNYSVIQDSSNVQIICHSLEFLRKVNIWLTKDSRFICYY